MKQENQPHLVRIVRLTLAPDRVDEFMEMFVSNRETIRSFDGCRHLELLQDTSFPNIIVTYSIWRDEAALNAYRTSDFFKGVWQRTKTMFAAPPIAFSSMPPAL